MTISAEIQQPSGRSPSLLDWKPEDVVELESQSKGMQRYRLSKLLGSGMTSVVWQAFHLETGLLHALKILRPESGSEFCRLFETERKVLYNLGHYFDEAGQACPAPTLYDWGTSSTSMHYMAMELVEGATVSSMVERRSNLPSNARTLAEQSRQLNAKLTKFGEEAFAEGSLSDDTKRYIPILNSHARELTSGLNELAAMLVDRPHREAFITEDGLIMIGKVTCQTFQILHEKMRQSYKDFQLKNFYLVNDPWQLKILDWNVVTELGDVRADDDLFNLSAALFYLIAQVMVKTGQNARELRRLGGPAWGEEISLALRLVLQRALSPNLADRFRVALLTGEVQQTELACPSELNSLGGAFTMLERCRDADAEDLMQLSENCLARHKVAEAQSIIDLARQVVERESLPDLRLRMEKKLGEAQKNISNAATTSNELLESCRQWLQASDPKQALEKIQEAIERDSSNLELYRWRAAVDYMCGLGYDRIKVLWASGALQNGLNALAEQNWQKAVQVFDPARFPIDALYHDACLNNLLNQAARLAEKIFIEPEQSELSQLVHVIETAEREYIQCLHPSYVRLIQNEWPGYADWRRQAESKLSIFEEKERMRKQLLNHPGALK